MTGRGEEHVAYGAIQRTCSNAIDVEFVERVLGNEDLYCAQGGENVGIVIGMCAKATSGGIRKGEKAEEGRTSVLIPAAHHVSDHLFPVEGVSMAHDAKCGESPVDGVHAKVCCEMIGEIIFALRDMSDQYGLVYVACSRFRGTVYKTRGEGRVVWSLSMPNDKKQNSAEKQLHDCK